MESSLSRTEAIIPSSGNATAGDTEGTAASDESLRDLSVDISKCWMEVGRNLQLTEGQLESLDKEGYITLREKIYQMLLVWKRKGGSAATYDVLGDALQKAGRLDLKEYLLKNYQPA
ncbi:receptor-interacting serine/threonine-protein kinase 1-like [Apostichopus japonicus]|uniref:receptor-interacting serine/threonine-protein kinase 1-like n=1 Tax=Stichopus japonicus TaxID=307972 RepID=UPI003AB50A0F